MDSIVRRLFNKKRRIRESENTPEDKYKDYLAKHRQGVKDNYYDIMLPILEDEGIDEEVLSRIEELIKIHDASKDDSPEFEAYSEYYYDKKNHSRSSEEYNQAWNHHQKSNPHHWQYWCLINDVDEPQLQPLDMPLEYVIEMLCDWQSAGHHYGNTAYEWYEQQKDKMLLSDNTRELVEKYIIHFK